MARPPRREPQHAGPFRTLLPCITLLQAIPTKMHCPCRRALKYPICSRSFVWLKTIQVGEHIQPPFAGLC